MGIGDHQSTYPNQTPNTAKRTSGVRLRAITSVVERETTLIAS
jgi:hypothetical protein